MEPIDIRRFMAEKQAAGQAPKSLQKMRWVLRQVLELAPASGAIKSNPVRRFRPPKPVQMEPVFLRADETLARATRPPYDLLVRLVAATGLRPSEVCGPSWEGQPAAAHDGDLRGADRRGRQDRGRPHEDLRPAQRGDTTIAP